MRLVSLFVAEAFLCSSVLSVWGEPLSHTSHLRPSASDGANRKDLMRDLRDTEAVRDGSDRKKRSDTGQKRGPDIRSLRRYEHLVRNAEELAAHHDYRGAIQLLQNFLEGNHIFGGTRQMARQTTSQAVHQRVQEAETRLSELRHLLLTQIVEEARTFSEREDYEGAVQAVAGLLQDPAVTPILTEETAQNLRSDLDRFRQGLLHHLQQKTQGPLGMIEEVLKHTRLLGLNDDQSAILLAYHRFARREVNVTLDRLAERYTHLNRDQIDHVIRREFPALLGDFVHLGIADKIAADDEEKHNLGQFDGEYLEELIRTRKEETGEYEIGDFEDLIDTIVRLTHSDDVVVRTHLQQFGIDSVRTFDQVRAGTLAFQGGRFQKREAAVQKRPVEVEGYRVYTAGSSSYLDRNKMDRQYRERVIVKLGEMIRSPTRFRLLGDLANTRILSDEIGNQRLYVQLHPTEKAAVIIAFESAGDIKREESGGALKHPFIQYLKTAASKSLSDHDPLMEETRDGGLREKANAVVSDKGYEKAMTRLMIQIDERKYQIRRPQIGSRGIDYISLRRDLGTVLGEDSRLITEAIRDHFREGEEPRIDTRLSAFETAVEKAVESLDLPAGPEYEARITESLNDVESSRFKLAGILTHLSLLGEVRDEAQDGGAHAMGYESLVHQLTDRVQAMTEDWRGTDPAFEEVLFNALASESRFSTLVEEYDIDLSDLMFEGTAGTPHNPLLSYMNRLEWQGVLSEIFDNAFHAMAESPVRQLTVETGKEGMDDFIRIADTGHGILPEDLPKIWEREYSRKPNGIQGVGSGLPTIKAIVEGHRGMVRVDSEPGKGTALTIRFPAVHADLSSQRPMAGASAHDGGFRVPNASPQAILNRATELMPFLSP